MGEGLRGGNLPPSDNFIVLSRLACTRYSYAYGLVVRCGVFVIAVCLRFTDTAMFVVVL